MENVKITGEVTISAQEYLDLRVDRGRLLLVESYVRTEEVLNRETLLDLFKRWKKKEEE